MDELAFVLCACGCGKKLYGSRKYFPGHKPKREKSTPEQRSARLSEAGKQRWAKEREDNPPKPLNDCACGCGEKVKGTWAWGHHSRVKNISKREDIKLMRSENFKKLHEEGILGEAWNKGLTKEDDPRIAKNVKNLVDWAKSEEGRTVRSNTMKEQWKSGVIVPLKGADHPQWKGGTSSLTQMLRGNHQLYIRWKRPILIRDRFLCSKCQKGSTEVRLAVHHDGERFAKILSDHLRGYFGEDVPDRELTFEEKSEICERVIDYHVQKNVSGITLCYECHEIVHNDEKDED